MHLRSCRSILTTEWQSEQPNHIAATYLIKINSVKAIVVITTALAPTSRHSMHKVRQDVGITMQRTEYYSTMGKFGVNRPTNTDIMGLIPQRDRPHETSRSILLSTFPLGGLQSQSQVSQNTVHGNLKKLCTRYLRRR